MPRLNIEEIWFADPRRFKLALKVGSAEMADGVALNMWRLAQRFYSVGLLVPKDKFVLIEYHSAFLEVGLAEERENGIYVRGQNDHFSWLKSRQEAGKKGGNAPFKQTEANGSKRKQMEASSSTSNTSIKDTRHKSPKLPKIAALWNEHAHPSLPRVRAMSRSSARLKKCNAAWRENPDKDFWVKVISSINKIPGLLGENDRGWKANLDFLLRSDTPNKILEGQYDNWGTKNSQSVTPLSERRFFE